MQLEGLNVKYRISPKKFGYWDIFKVEYTYFNIFIQLSYKIQTKIYEKSIQLIKIRQKGLLSSAGFSVLILGLLNLVWVITGFKRYYYHHSYTCARSFQNTLYANIIIPLISLIPFVLTLICSFFIKISSLILSWLMPGVFINLKKSI